MEARHGLAVSIGGVIVTVGLAGLGFGGVQASTYHVWWTNGTLDAFLALCVLIWMLGMYLALSPLTGFPMPPTYAERQRRKQRGSVSVLPATPPAVEPALAHVLPPAPEALIDGPVPPPRPRYFVDADPAYLLDLFRAHTSIQAHRLIEPHIGTWRRLSGPLGDVSATAIGCQARFSMESQYSLLEDTLVLLYFEGAESISRLSVLRRGTEITVIGEIESVDALAVSLINCELESP